MKYPLLLLSSGWWLLAAWCSGRGVCKQPWSGGHWGSPTQLVISVFNPSQPPGLLQRLQLTAGEVNWKPAMPAEWLLMAWHGIVAADGLGGQSGCWWLGKAVRLLMALGREYSIWWPWRAVQLLLSSMAADDLGRQYDCWWPGRAEWQLMTLEGSAAADDLGAVWQLMTSEGSGAAYGLGGQYGYWWPGRAEWLLMT